MNILPAWLRARPKPVLRLPRAAPFAPVARPIGTRPRMLSPAEINLRNHGETQMPNPTKADIMPAMNVVSITMLEAAAAITAFTNGAAPSDDLAKLQERLALVHSCKAIISIVEDAVKAARQGEPGKAPAESRLQTAMKAAHAESDESQVFRAGFEAVHQALVGEAGEPENARAA